MHVLMEQNSKRKMDMLKCSDAKRMRPLSSSSSSQTETSSTANNNVIGTKKENDVVQKCWNNTHLDEIASKIGNIRLTVKDLHTLKHDIWLNDQIIDAYMELIRIRSQKNPALPKVYVFSTFFYTALMQRGYGGVSRWTAKVDIFLYDLLLFPIHSGDHWSLVAIDLKKDLFGYFDSMEFQDNETAVEIGRDHIKRIFDYLKKESLERRGKKYERKSRKASTFNSPIQDNENDCGVFICGYAEGLSLGREFGRFEFTQEDIPRKRRNITYELLSGSLIES